MRIWFAALAASLTLSATAAAQTQSEPPAAPTYSAEQVAARANDILSAAAAADLFSHEPHVRAILLRHTRSGMLCRFAYRQNGTVSIVPSESLGIPRGDDVACNEDTELGSFTLYATRRPENVDEALAGAIAAIRARFTRVREVDLARIESIPDERMRVAAVDARHAAFTVRMDGRDMFTRVSIFSANGWVYKLRFTSPEQRHNILAEILWRAMINDIVAYEAAAPAESAN